MGASFSLFGVLWVISGSVQDTLELEWGQIGKKQRKTWQARPFCLFWSVSKARNAIVFRDEILSIQRLNASFVFCFGRKPSCLYPMVLRV